MRVGVIFFNFIGPGAVRPTSSGAWIHELGTHLGYFRSSHFSSRKFRWALNEIFALKLLTQIVYKFKSEISSRNFGKSKLIPTKIFIGERVSSKKLFQKFFFVKEIMIWDDPKVWTKIDGTEFLDHVEEIGPDFSREFISIIWARYVFLPVMIVV